MPTTHPSAFGSLLKRHRLAAGLSQEALAELSGLSADAISMLERGARRAPHAATVDLLAAALRLSDQERDALREAAAVSRHRHPRAVPAHTEPASLAGLFPPARALPVPLAALVGRERALAAVTTLLREGAPARPHRTRRRRRNAQGEARASTSNIRALSITVRQGGVVGEAALRAGRALMHGYAEAVNAGRAHRVQARPREDAPEDWDVAKPRQDRVVRRHPERDDCGVDALPRLLAHPTPLTAHAGALPCSSRPRVMLVVAVTAPVLSRGRAVSGAATHRRARTV